VAATQVHVWGHRALYVELGVEGLRPWLRILQGSGEEVHQAPVSLPLVEVLAAGHGRSRAGARSVDTAIGARLQLASTRTSERDGWMEFVIELRDPVTSLLVALELSTMREVAVLRSRVRVVNGGPAPLTLLAVTSLVLGGLPDPARLELLAGRSDWLAEGRFTRQPLRSWLLPDLSLACHEADGRGAVAAESSGTWSTEGDLPVAGLLDSESGGAWLWQVEHNGPWRWEVGEQRDGAYVLLSGPTDDYAQWRQTLQPGDTFTTVPASIAITAKGGLEAAAARLTTYRRAARRGHEDNLRLPVVFNDYMNTLMGDPSTERLLPLIDAAAEAGAEVFCIDAGWYDETGDWWDSVGEWKPSSSRFPGGIDEVLDRIRRHGMRPGLWLEPEVVGVHSPLADKLPEEAFFQRAGVRHREHQRFHLDLRHPDAVAHLNSVVDRLVEGHGVDYFKLDYNINPGPGTESGGESAGAGLLGHNRAYLAWLDGVLGGHPGLVLENCASGAMRMDFALLSRLQLQSTSDQQDPLRYPPIAAAAPLSLLPEQAANWAYPQPDMSGEEIAFTMCTGLAGRLYLSGRLDGMTPEARGLVAEGVRLHQQMRGTLKASLPFWPLGLPGWDDRWVALGMQRPEGDAYLIVWSRHGSDAGRRVLEMPLPETLAGRDVRIAYPQAFTGWDAAVRPDGRLRLTVHCAGPTARVLHFPAVAPD
jgi:alpha-galactosidase